MTLETDRLFVAMHDSAVMAAGGIWVSIKSFLVPELRKLALTLVDIESGVASGDYTEESARILWDMQCRATAAVIVATTALVLIDVQKLLNSILASVKDVANTAIGFPLI